MILETWADTDLSEKLPLLCAQGEGESLEFKRELPAQKRDFPKEIAALASTAGGMILIGVEDDGTVIGVPGAESSASVRDELRARIVGLSQLIEPPVRPKLAWASFNGNAVLCVQVEKGSEPIYYVDSRPYIRHSTVSRPATAAEVQAALSPPAAASSVHSHLSELALLLANVLRWCDIDEDMRCLTPWVDEWTFEAEHYAAQLRTMATSDWALENAQGESLEALAETLDEVSGFTHALGAGASFEEVCREVRANADALMKKLIWPVKVDAESEAAVRSKVLSYSRQLDSTWARAAKNLFDGRVEKAREESARVGADLANWTYLPLAFLTEDSRPKLRQAALGLVGLASFRTYMDGGESLRRLVERGRQLTDELLDVARTL